MASVQYIYHEHEIQKQAKLEKAFLESFHTNEYTFDKPLVVLNPYGIAPLTALILFKLAKPSTVKITVSGKAAAGDLRFEYPVAVTHYIPVYGLYPDYINKVTLELEDGTISIIEIQTEAAPESIHLPEYVHTTPEYFGENVMFVTPSSFSKLVAFDYVGDLRWYTTLDVVFDIKRVSNGRIWIATERLIELPYVVTGIYEMSMLGKIYKEYRLPGGTHHDYVEDKDGNIIILTADPNRNTVEDVCVVLSRETGKIIKTFDLRHYFAPEAASGDRSSSRDWLHCNAVWYDEATNSLSFSGRNLDAIANVDYETKELNWIIGDPNKWPQDYIDNYLLKQEDNQEEFDWFYAQHSCRMLPDGDIFIFDNGAWRSKYKEKDIPSEEKFSRGVRYHINRKKRTVRQVWQYGKEKGSDFFSPHISNVEYYSEGNYMIHSGDIGQIAGKPCDRPPIFFLDKPEGKDLIYYSKTIEIESNRVAYEMKIPRNAYYRAKKLSLYDASEEINFDEGVQLGTLGKSQTCRVKLPAKSQPLPVSYQAKVVDEIDRFQLSILLKPGTYACLILKNNNDQKAYLIPTTEKDALTMCVGTFQPSEANETYLTLSKDGIFGLYHFYILIENKLYDMQLELSF